MDNIIDINKLLKKIIYSNIKPRIKGLIIKEIYDDSYMSKEGTVNILAILEMCNRLIREAFKKTVFLIWLMNPNTNIIYSQGLLET